MSFFFRLSMLTLKDKIVASVLPLPLSREKKSQLVLPLMKSCRFGWKVVSHPFGKSHPYFPRLYRFRIGSPTWISPKVLGQDRPIELNVHGLHYCPRLGDALLYAPSFLSQPPYRITLMQVEALSKDGSEPMHHFVEHNKQMGVFHPHCVGLAQGLLPHAAFSFRGVPNPTAGGWSVEMV